MMKDCRRGKIDRIYTKSISRFARNTKDCLKNVRELKSLGITIFFEKENIDTAKMTDEMMITIMGGLAQEESTSISKNIKWSIQKKGCRTEHIKTHVPHLDIRFKMIH
jgi:site-specific DNA recombinase